TSRARTARSSRSMTSIGWKCYAGRKGHSMVETLLVARSRLSRGARVGISPRAETCHAAAATRFCFVVTCADELAAASISLVHESGDGFIEAPAYGRKMGKKDKRSEERRVGKERRSRRTGE